MLKNRAVNQSGKNVHGQLSTQMIRVERDTTKRALKFSHKLCETKFTLALPSQTLSASNINPLNLS